MVEVSQKEDFLQKKTASKTSLLSSTSHKCEWATGQFKKSTNNFDRFPENLSEELSGSPLASMLILKPCGGWRPEDSKINRIRVLNAPKRRFQNSS